MTGGAGFIGAALALELVRQGARVRVFDNLIASSRDAVPEGAEFVLGDLRNPEDIRKACEGVDVVFHQAAIRSVPRSVDEPTLTHDCNLTGTLNLLLAAEATDVRRVVYASSSSVYGGTDGISRESDPTSPLSPYAVSKLGGENYCRVWTLLGRLSTVSLRYFNVFGPGQRPDSKYAAVFPAFVSALLAGAPPEIHWDGEQSRDFTFIDDVVEANLAAGDAGPDADGAVLNIAGGKPRTINEVFDAVSKAVDVEVAPARVPKRIGDIRHSHADISEAGTKLGWKARCDWREAVSKTVGWFQEIGV